MTKEIWIPKSETSVVVQDGKLWIREEMIMNPKKIDKPKAGFSEDRSNSD